MRMSANKTQIAYDNHVFTFLSIGLCAPCVFNAKCVELILLATRKPLIKGLLFLCLLLILTLNGWSTIESTGITETVQGNYEFWSTFSCFLLKINLHIIGIIRLHYSICWFSANNCVLYFVMLCETWEMNVSLYLIIHCTIELQCTRAWIGNADEDIANGIIHMERQTFSSPLSLSKTACKCCLENSILWKWHKVLVIKVTQ